MPRCLTDWGDSSNQVGAAGITRDGGADIIEVEIVDFADCFITNAVYQAEDDIVLAAVTAAEVGAVGHAGIRTQFGRIPGIVTVSGAFDAKLHELNGRSWIVWRCHQLHIIAAEEGILCLHGERGGIIVNHNAKLGCVTIPTRFTQIGFIHQAGFQGTAEIEGQFIEFAIEEDVAVCIGATTADCPAITAVVRVDGRVVAGPGVGHIDTVNVDGAAAACAAAVIIPSDGEMVPDVVINRFCAVDETVLAGTDNAHG